MHHGAIQSSPAQQMVAAGGPAWWTINNIRPPAPLPLPQPHNHFPHPSLLVAPPSSSWNIDSTYEIIPHLSCSQLLLGGVVGGEDNKAEGLRALENWEQQLLNLTSNSTTTMSDYTTAAGGHGSQEFQAAATNNNTCWPNQMPCVSSPLTSSCVTTLSSSMVDFSPKSSECNSNGTTIGGGVAKKPRIQPPSAQSTFKVRKEKLGDRITALHQLVSPFGKTDTASVLLEAIGYIRFLQSQIEALSLPYLATKSAPHPPPGSDEKQANNLRSRGLCLVPISSTLQVGSDNGADYWAPAFGAHFQ